MEIPASAVLPEEVQTMLRKKAQGAKPGDIFLLSTNLIEKTMWKSGKCPEFRSSIVSSHYLGVVGGHSFIIGDGTPVSYILELSAACYVQSGSDAVVEEPLRVHLGFDKYLNPEEPIPVRYLPFQQILDEDEIYPFTLVIGQDSIEQYVAKHAHVTEFYLEAHRLLGLSAPTMDLALRQADDEHIRKLVLMLYIDWQWLVGRIYDSKQLLKEPSWQRLIEDAVSGRPIWGKRSEVVQKRIRDRLEKLELLGVFDEGLFYDMPQAPGLSLDVSEFLCTLEQIFPIHVLLRKQ